MTIRAVQAACRPAGLFGRDDMTEKGRAQRDLQRGLRTAPPDRAAMRGDLSVWRFRPIHSRKGVPRPGWAWIDKDTERITLSIRGVDSNFRPVRA